MNEIRSFVGHSFVDADTVLVEKFLKYFDRISKLIPNFSWEHAEAAEPRFLTEKVLSLIEGKNVFIGICTKKELVIDASSLSSSFISSSYRRAKLDSFQWKTSDWILQEIGLAKGRGLELILLVEEGLRQPGGLQGNVEYISFERNAPEKSFGKILEMITALSPGATGEPPGKSAAAASAPVTDGIRSPGGDDAEHLNPRHDWTEDEFESAILRAVIGDNEGAIKQIDEAYRASPHASQGDNAVVWSARLEWFKILFQEGETLDRLRGLAAENSKNIKVVEYLAKSLGEYEHRSEAAERFEEASELSDDPVEKIRLEGAALRQYGKDGRTEKYGNLVRSIKSKAASGKEAEVAAANALKDFFEVTRQNNALIAAMERMVELVPDDFSTRFSLGYEHSEVGNRDLAFVHYRKIPYQLRSRVTWNNLGVVLDQFNMPNKSVEAYRAAEKQGETLAMANLGYKFLAAGFLHEAQQLCDKALGTKDFHKNVSELLVRVKSIIEEEDSKRDEVLAKARPKAEFFRRAGAAVLAIEPTNIDGSWQGPECSLSLVCDGADLKMSGAFEREPSRLLMALGGTSANRVTTKHKIEFTGTLRGRLVDGSVQRTDDGPKSLAVSSLGIGDDPLPALMLLNETGDEIQVMENPFGSSPNYYVLRRQS